jgi:DNA-binding NtrC family response regulator
MAHVLIVDDDANARIALAELVALEGFTAAIAGTLREARIQMTRQHADVMLIDLYLPDGNGMELVQDVERPGETEIILVTGNATVDTAVEALRIGATDYLVKPINVARLRAILSRVPKPSDLQAQIGSLRGELRQLGHFGRMLGKSAPMQSLYDRISRVSPTEATVLLVGESGTGKELVAQTIHDLSRRSRKPCLAVNCGAISPNLIESEMFGHERGSFTGADKQHIGYFERADGGTLFLDEITEMPIELQVKLLRVLETGRIMRIGTGREIDTDVRVLAATNRDPESAVSEGKLRPDLYHRLNVFPLYVPPLRERYGDVQLLAQHFLDGFNKTHRSHKVFAPGVLDQLAQHRWAGNVRELRNFVQRAWILADHEIDTSALALDVSPTKHVRERTVQVSVGMSLAEVDKCVILATLEQCGGVKKYSAELLGISLKTLYNRLEEYRLESGIAGASNDLEVDSNEPPMSEIEG